MKNYASLGTVAVMDADRLRPGTYTEIDGQVFVVEKTEGEINVYLSPVLGWELFMYKWKTQFTLLGKTCIVSVVLAVTFLLYYVVSHFIGG